MYFWEYNPFCFPWIDFSERLVSPRKPMLILAIAIIGFSAGLRTFTAPAIVTWSAYLGYLNLDQTPCAFVASPIAVAIFTALAFGEYVWDILPSTPSRTEAPGLIGRTLTGAFTAACLLAATGNNLAFCIVGSVAAVCGAFAGYQTRVRLVRALGVKDLFVAIPEDLVAIGLAVFAVSLVTRL